MMKKDLFIIAREGWKYIIYTFLIFILSSILDFDLFAIFAFICFLFLLFIFRNPERESINLKEIFVVSPIDGKVTEIVELCNSEYNYKIDIESSPYDVGILRVPVSSDIMTVKIVRGTRTSKKSKLFSSLNEYGEIIFMDSKENKVKVLHRLKQSIAPISINLISKQSVVQGARYGISLNSISSIYLKTDTELKVKVGEEVKASETILTIFN